MYDESAGVQRVSEGEGKPEALRVGGEMYEGEAQKKRYCNHCKQEVYTVVEILSSGPHYGKESCQICSRFVGFTKKPKNEGKRPKNKHTAKSLGITFCQMCLRHGDRLGSRGALEVHHVVEINCGGEDVPENIWVICTSCHKLIHHQRTYLNIHLKDQYSLAELKKDMDHYGVPESMRGVMERIFNKQEAVNA